MALENLTINIHCKHTDGIKEFFAKFNKDL